jgi:hypothetical protein
VGASKLKSLVGLAYQGNNIVFRFIIEYSRLRDKKNPIKIDGWNHSRLRDFGP